MMINGMGLALICTVSSQAGCVDCQGRCTCECRHTVVASRRPCQCIEGGGCDAVGTATDRFPCAPCQGGQGGRHIARVIHKDIAIPGRHSAVDNACQCHGNAGE